MAIGIMEIQNLVNAYKAYDMMVKNSDVTLIHERKAIGGRLITMVFEGSVSDLEAAFDTVIHEYKDTKRLKVAQVVPSPTRELMNYFKKGVFS